MGENSTTQNRGRLTLEHGELIIRAPYDHQRVIDSKRIAGRRWIDNAEHYPMAYLPQVEAYAQSWGMEIDLTPVGEAPLQVVRVDAKTIGCSPEFHARNTFAGAIYPSKARFDRVNKRWLVTVGPETTDRVIHALRGMGLRIDPELLA